MKSKIIATMALLAVIVFLVGCPRVPKVITAKAVEQPKPEKPAEVLVEVLDFKMEKIAGNWLGEEYGTIRITGTAIYHGDKPFHEILSGLIFGLYDDRGNRVRGFTVLSCGEYNDSRNIVKGKPFPFQDEDQIKKSLWDVIKEARFEKVQK